MLNKPCIFSVETVSTEVVLNGKVVRAAYGTNEVAILVRELVNNASSPILVFDFERVNFIDVSLMLDVIIPVKQLSLRRPKTLIMKNPCQEALTSIRAALALYREQTGNQCCFLIYNKGQYSLVGHTEPNLMTAFSFVAKYGCITANELQRLAGIEICNASTRLKRLLDAGVVLRERLIDRSGAYHLYSLPQAV